MKRLAIAALGLAVMMTCVSESGWSTSSNDELDWLYTHIATEKQRYSEGVVEIPIFVSIPPSATSPSSLSVELRNSQIVPLSLGSSGIHLAHIEVIDLPNTVSLRIRVDGQVATPWLVQEIENSYQTISIGLSELPGIPPLFSLPEGFRSALMPTDVWGGFVYGRDDDTHTRAYIDSVLQRISETGSTDVLFVSFLGWSAVSPLPILSTQEQGGTIAVGEEDLEYFTQRAHALGLRVTLRFFAVMLDGRDDLRPILFQRHSQSWMQSFFDQYQRMMIEQAIAAENAGVDVFMLNLDDAGLLYEGLEEAWSRGIGKLVESIREVFSGEIGYDLRLNDVAAILEKRLPLEGLAGIDMFYLGNTLTRGGYPGDSIEDFKSSFHAHLAHISEVRKLLGNRPIILGTMPMSYEGFAEHGYINAVVPGEDANRSPDFLAQARYLEAIFQYVAESGVFSGVHAGWIHWDDPLGPDLPGGTLARMDLGVSVRNKPAEAVLKRWLGGSNELRFHCEAPPCSSMKSIPSYVATSPEALTSVLLIDDFEDALDQTFMGWEIDHDSQEFHDPGSDPGSSCEIAIVESGGSRWLQLDYTNNSWLAVRYWGFPSFDAREYTGIEMTLWIDKPSGVDVTIGMTSESMGWVGARLARLLITSTPTTYRLPFSDFVVQEDRNDVLLIDALLNLINVSIHVPRGSGTIGVDDIRFYNSQT